VASIDDRIGEIEEEIQKTSYNKASQHHIGKLKAKLAQLREKQLKSSGKGGGSGFSVKKSGDATVVLVGYPSVGKSTLLNKLTNAESRVADFEFTTLTTIPGMMDYDGLKIQLLDLPGIISGAAGGKGRGKEVLSAARNANLCLILEDVIETERIQGILDELYNVGFRLNKKPVNVSIEKTVRGGVNVITTIKNPRLTHETVRSVLNAYGIHNANVTLNEDVNEDGLIDALSKNRIYVPMIIALNKIDQSNSKIIEARRRKFGVDCVVISAEKEIGLTELRKKMVEKLGLIRVYLKPQNRKPDYSEPMILPVGSTVGGLCNKMHSRMKFYFRYAMVWGKSVKHEGQRVGLTHKFADKDVVTIIKRS